jgi:hypothetical protein
MFDQIVPTLIKNNNQLLKLAIIAIVLLAAGAIAPRLPVDYALMAVGGVLVLVGVIFFLRWPALGLIALVIASLLVPYSVNLGGAEINLPVLIIALLVGLFVFDAVALKRKVVLETPVPIIAALGFGVVAIIAFGLGLFPWFLYSTHAPITAQVAGLATFLLSVATFLLATQLFRDIEWLEWLVGIFLFISTLYMMIGVVPQLNQIFFKRLPNGALGSMLWTWTGALALGQVLFNNKLKWYWRVAIFGLVILTSYLAFVPSNSWKSGWLPMFLAMAVIVWFRFPRLRIIMALCGVGAFLLLLPELVASDQYSYSTRVAAWQIIFTEIVKVNPLLGLGPANYYYYTPLFPILGYSVNFNSHNNYLDMIAQTGLVGLIMFFWFAFEIGKMAYRLVPRLPDGFPRAFVIAAIGGLAGTLASGMLGDWVVPFIYNIGLRGLRASLLAWLFLGSIVAIDKIYEHKLTGEGPEHSDSLQGI